mmetsp:Transcript_177363/g.568714  ORF Transcript_177363/g.568714 Transcript_177363/m.568714 type:complete len:335 (-) Transcript_177363:634-1638(-)
MGLARVRDLLRPIALRERDQRCPVRLEDRHVRVHAAGRRRSKRPRRHAVGRLRGSCIVDGVVLHVVRKFSGLLKNLIQLRMRDVSGHDEGSRQLNTRLDRILRQLRQDLRHGLVQVDLHRDAHRGVIWPRFGLDWQEARRVVLELLDEDSLRIDLRQDLAVRATRHAEANGTARAVAGQADHAAVVREVLASELCTHLEVLADLQRLGFPIEIPEGAAVLVARGRKEVVIPRACQLHGLEAHLGRGASDDQRNVVRGASARAQGLHLFLDECLQLLRVEQSLCLLVQVRFVGRAAALGHEMELVGASLGREDVELAREVRLRVLLREHGDWCDL